MSNGMWDQKYKRTVLHSKKNMGNKKKGHKIRINNANIALPNGKYENIWTYHHHSKKITLADTIWV